MAEEGSDKIGTLWMALAGISSFTGVAISLVAMWQVSE